MSARIDYKKELERASKSMILVHDPRLLIKMILRVLVQRVNVTQACMLLNDRHRDTYVLTVSGGARGLKIPQGFARIDAENALIRYFRQCMSAGELHVETLEYDSAQRKLRRSRALTPLQKEMLQGALYQMEIFNAVTVIPTYFRNEILGLLLLGRKKNGRGFSREELDFFLALASDAAMALRNAQLFKDLENEAGKKRRLFINTTIALTAAIDAKDHYTHGHTARVTELSLVLAREFGRKNRAQFGEEFFDHLQIASLLHDIGKIGIPESILNKQGPLDDSERLRMQEHPQVGVNILEPIRELEDCVLGVKYHHEHYDGGGYPEGLKGSEIPLIASIISVADAYDAMVTDRPYRKALSKDETMRQIQKESGCKFDPYIAGVLLDLCRQNKI